MNRTIRRVLAILVLLCGCDAQPNADVLLRDARSSLERGESAIAQAAVRNALRLNPDVAEARALLGEIRLANGDHPAAIKELERALSLGHPPAHVLPMLAAAHVGQQHFDDVLALPVEGLPDEPRAVVLGYQAIAALAAGRTHSQAYALARQAVGLAPEGRLPNIALARAEAARGDHTAAIARLEPLASAVDPALRELLAELHATGGDRASAIELLSDILARDPDRTSARLKRARLWIAAGDTMAARADLARLEQSPVTESALHELRGRLALLDSRVDEAQTHFELALTTTPDSVDALAALAFTHLALDNVEQAEQAVRTALRRRDDIALRRLLATIQLSAQRPQDAIATIQRDLLATDVELDTLRVLATALLRSSRHAEAIDVLSSVSAREHGSDDLAPVFTVRPAERLAIAAGAPVRARRDERPASPFLDATSMRIATVFAHLQAGELTAATAEAATFARARPRDPTARYLYAHVRLAATDISDAMAELEAVLAMRPSHPQATLLLAGLEAAIGERASARARLRTAMRVPYATDAKPYRLLARLMRLDGELSAADAILRTAEIRFPNAARATLDRALASLEAGEPARALQHLERLSAEDRNTATSVAIEVSALIRSDRWREALRRLHTLIRIEPDVPRWQKLRAGMLEKIEPPDPTRLERQEERDTDRRQRELGDDSTKPSRQ